MVSSKTQADSERQMAIAIVELISQLNPARQALLFKHNVAGVTLEGLNYLQHRSAVGGTKMSFQCSQQLNLAISLIKEKPADYLFTQEEALRILGQQAIKSIVHRQRELAKTVALSVLDLLVKGWKVEAITEERLTAYASACRKPACNCSHAQADRNVQFTHGNLPRISSDARTLDRGALHDYLQVNELGSIATLIESYGFVCQAWELYVSGQSTDFAYSQAAPVRFG